MKQIVPIKESDKGSEETKDWYEALLQWAEENNIDIEINVFNLPGHLNIDNGVISDFPKEVKESRTQGLFLHNTLFEKPLKDIVYFSDLKAILAGGCRLLQESLEYIFLLEKLDSVSFINCFLLEVPKSISNLKNLKSINLSHNLIYKLPKEIGELENLEEIELINNPLFEIPSEINNLKKLKRVVLPTTVTLQPELKHLEENGVIQWVENDGSTNDLARKYRSFKYEVDFTVHQKLLIFSTLMVVKTDLLSNLHSFELRHKEELSELYETIYRLKKELGLYSNEEAKKEEEKLNEPPKEEPIELTDAEHKESKKIFRDLSKMCHPDLVDSHLKEEAHKIFLKLNDAYQNNDLQSLKDLEARIRNFGFKLGEELTYEDKIRQDIAKIEISISETVNEIKTIYGSERFKLSKANDLDQYFVEERERLSKEIERLKSQL